MTPEEYVQKIEALNLHKMLEREAAYRKVKRFFIKAAGIAAVIGILAGAKAVHAAEYPGLLRITEVNKEKNLVTGVDANGFLWGFSECEDWEENDLCAVIYDDKGTELVFDDEIVSARYVGIVEMY